MVSEPKAGTFRTPSYSFEQYLTQSKLRRLCNVYQVSIGGGVKQTNSGYTKYQGMGLLFETSDIPFEPTKLIPIPSSQFMLDILRAVNFKFVIIVAALAITSFLILGSPLVGLAVGAVYTVGVLAKPCYQGFFRESPQSKALRQEVDSEPIDLAQLFQEHFCASQEDQLKIS